MTFTFTMDCFPAYIKGDYTRKMFFAMDIVADETIHPDIEAEEEECPELEITFSEVKAGASDWATKEFPDDPKKVNFLTLGNNLSATIDRANVDFAGNLKRIDNWTAFSSKPEDLTGYYFPFTMKAEDGSKLVRTTRDGTEKELVFGQTGDGEGQINVIWAVDEDAPVVNATLKSSDGSKSQVFSFDFSKCIYR